MKTKKFKLRMNRRAVSPVIATLLLIAIAVAVSVVTYSWTMSLAQNNSQQAQTSIKIDIVQWDNTEHTVTATVRNTGSVAATIEEMFVYKGDAFINSNAPVGGTTIQAASTGDITVTDNPDIYTVNTPYRIRIVTSTGFVAEGTYYSPGA